MKRFYLFLSILFLTIFMSSCSNDPSNPSPEEGYSKLIIKAETKTNPLRKSFLQEMISYGSTEQQKKSGLKTITINKTPFHFMPILNFIWMTSICFLP